MQDGPIPLFGSLPSAVSRQWGVNAHGIVTLPVACQSINKIVPAHSGINFIDTKVRETNPLIKFTLDVGGNTGNYEDAQWGSFKSIDSGSFVTMPLAATPFQVVVNDMNDDGNALCMSTLNYATGKFKVTGVRNNLNKTQLWGHWIAVCN